MTRWTWVWIVLIVLLVIAGLFYAPRYRDAVDGHLCAVEYAHARTANDSGMIDVAAPSRNRGRGELASPMPTCGELRRLGKVR